MSGHACHVSSEHFLREEAGTPPQLFCMKYEVQSDIFNTVSINLLWFLMMVYKSAVIENC